MESDARERAALVAFFLPLTRRTCEELAVGDETIATYLADVLAEFARSDRLHRIRAADGRRVESVVEMLAVARTLEGADAERAFHRYLGDYTLFMSGLFRPFVERGGHLGWYLAEGARAYARVASLGGDARRDRLLYRELATRFEHYAGALDYLRKVRFPGLAGPDPFGAFLREIATMVGAPSRN
jgi:hypothetical protein